MPVVGAGEAAAASVALELLAADALIQLAKEGHTARQLIAYGPAWYGWYIRRLAERPANVLFVARQMVG